MALADRLFESDTGQLWQGRLWGAIVPGRDSLDPDRTLEPAAVLRSFLPYFHSAGVVES